MHMDAAVLRPVFRGVQGHDLFDSGAHVLAAGRLHGDDVVLGAVNRDDVDEVEQVLADSRPRIPMLDHLRRVALVAQLLQRPSRWACACGFFLLGRRLRRRLHR